MAVRAVIGVAMLLAVAACGSDTKLPQAPPSGGLTNGAVSFAQTGNASAQIDQTTVAFSLDTAGSLVVKFTVKSTGSSSQTIVVRSTLYDTRLSIIGDAQGGEVNVAPGASVAIQLNGPAPSGTISSALFEVTALSAPTPTSNGTPTAGTPPASTLPTLPA
jgi:hypothetical protein